MDRNQVAAAIGGHLKGAPLRGLDWLVGGEHAVATPDAGEVYAAGQLATLVAQSAAAPRIDRGGLRAALADFGVPEALAETFANGVREGGVLLFVRRGEEQVAAAGEALQQHKARHVGRYPR